MKRGVIMVSYGALAAILRLPEGHEITAIVPQNATDVATGRVQLIVQGPQMPEHREGVQPEIVSLTLDMNGRAWISR